MRQLVIDFGTGRRSPRVWAMVCFAAAALICVSALWRFMLVQRQFGETERQLMLVRTLAASQAPDVRKLPVFSLPGDEIKNLNSVVAQLNMPWGQLLSRIEELPEKDVALVALEPGGATRSMRLVAEARDAAAMFAFVGRASEARAFGPGAVLLKYDVDPLDVLHSYRFELLVPWGSGP